MTNILDFQALAFDVYGTIIDWEGGMLSALQPLTTQLKTPVSKEDLFVIVNDLEKEQQASTPKVAYRDILATIYPKIAQRLGLSEPSQDESAAFGASVGTWPAFPDSVDALKRLSKHYKLVVISNTDHQSFSGTQSGPLQGFQFDLVLLAQDMGCYKPDPKAFAHLESQISSKLGISKDKILQTAQSQFHDHYPANKAGIKSCWIARSGAIMGNVSEPIYNWKFNTLGEMATAVEEAATAKN